MNLWIPYVPVGLAGVLFLRGLVHAARRRDEQALDLLRLVQDIATDCGLLGTVTSLIFVTILADAPSHERAASLLTNLGPALGTTAAGITLLLLATAFMRPIQRRARQNPASNPGNTFNMVMDDLTTVRDTRTDPVQRRLIERIALTMDDLRRQLGF